jgi:hypothetical protein
MAKRLGRGVLGGITFGLFLVGLATPARAQGPVTVPASDLGFHTPSADRSADSNIEQYQRATGTQRPGAILRSNGRTFFLFGHGTADGRLSVYEVPASNRPLGAGDLRYVPASEVTQSPELQQAIRHLRPARIFAGACYAGNNGTITSLAMQNPGVRVYGCLEPRFSGGFSETGKGFACAVRSPTTNTLYVFGAQPGSVPTPTEPGVRVVTRCAPIPDAVVARAIGDTAGLGNTSGPLQSPKCSSLVGKTCVGLGLAPAITVLGGVVTYESESPTLGLVASTGVGVGTSLATVGARATGAGLVPGLVGSGAEFVVTYSTGSEQCGMGAGVLASAGAGACMGGPPGAVVGATAYTLTRLAAESANYYEAWRESQRIESRNETSKYDAFASMGYKQLTPNGAEDARDVTAAAENMRSGKISLQDFHRKLMNSADTRWALEMEWQKVARTSAPKETIDAIVAAWGAPGFLFPLGAVKSSMQMTREAYVGFLNREPTADELKFHVLAFLNGDRDLNKLARGIAESEEARLVAEAIVPTFYQGILGRSPMAGEVAAWRKKMLDELLPLAGVKQGFEQSAEKAIGDAIRNYWDRQPQVESCGAASAEVMDLLKQVEGGKKLSDVIHGIAKHGNRGYALGNAIPELYRTLLGRTPSEDEVMRTMVFADGFYDTTLPQLRDHILGSPERMVIDEFVKRMGRLPKANPNGGVSEEITDEVNAIAEGDSIKEEFARIQGREEAKTYAENTAQSLFLQHLGRAPASQDAPLMDALRAAIRTGGGITEAMVIIATHPATAVVRAYAQHLGRVPSEIEVNEWVKQIKPAGAFSAEDISKAIASSEEAQKRRRLAIAAHLETSGAGISTDDLERVVGEWEQVALAADIPIETLLQMIRAADTAANAQELKCDEPAQEEQGQCTCIEETEDEWTEASTEAMQVPAWHS